MNSLPAAVTLATPDEVPALIRDLYAIVSKLESIFPGRHFTPDGHLVGSIGEALANTYYAIELCRASTIANAWLRQGEKPAPIVSATLLCAPIQPPTRLQEAPALNSRRNGSAQPPCSLIARLPQSGP